MRGRDGCDQNIGLFVEASAHGRGGLSSRDLRARMKVLLLSAGNSIHTVRWANAYSERGCSVDLVTQHAPLIGLSSAVGVHSFPHLGGLGYLLNGPRFKHLVEKLRPDVVNAHYATGYGTIARWCGSVPLVLNVWGSDVFAFPERGPLHRWWLRRNLVRADRIVSASVAMAERTRSFVGDLVPISVVPFGVDMDLFHPAAPHSGPGVVNIGTVKTLEPHYGIDVLMEAFILLCRMESLPDLRLHIVGKGSEKARLETMVMKAGVQDRVTFFGAVPHAQVPNELRQLDIYSALSREESFGVAVVEAQACGLPVVVSDVGGLPEVVQHGITGYVVAKDDARAAADALATLIRDPAKRQRMGGAGRSFVLANFSWDNCVERMLAVLREASVKRSE